MTPGNETPFSPAPFKFGMCQVVKHNGKYGTVIGRAEHVNGEPTYLVSVWREPKADVLTPARESELDAA